MDQFLKIENKIKLRRRILIVMILNSITKHRLKQGLKSNLDED